MFVPPTLTPADIKIAKDVTAIVKTMVETAVAFFKNLQRSQPKKDGDRKNGKFNPKRGDKVNTIILVGMEGVGKTELIKKCFRHPEADSTTTTDKFAIYTSQPSEDRKYWVNVADYQGQRIEMLVSNFIEHQLLPDSPLKYGSVNSLIVLVDLRRPEDDRRNNATPRPAADTARVKANLGLWNEMAIDAIFGLVTVPALKYICVFVNKYDLVTNTKRYSKKRAAKSYAKLVDYLRLKVPSPKASGNIKVDVIIGSAKTGEGQDELLANIAQYSSPYGQT
jgi:signal recognition particle receptor subunit beta